VWTYCVGGELRRVVVDVGDPDDSGGGVGQAVRGVPLHVRRLDDQRVLGDFLETQNEESQQLTQYYKPHQTSLNIGAQIRVEIDPIEGVCQKWNVVLSKHHHRAASLQFREFMTARCNRGSSCLLHFLNF